MEIVFFWGVQSTILVCLYSLATGCSLNIVFFSNILKYSGLLPFSVFPRCQCVYAHKAGRTPALQHNRQSSENFEIQRKKHND